jgi:ElaB/YqjD/DUF883 family membrane-anchored ribosome-binding protein
VILRPTCRAELGSSSTAPDIAIDALDEAQAAVRRNPLMAIGIALGLGFLFGIVAAGRR